MNKLTEFACAFALLAIASPALSCDYPSRVDIPNGSSASKEEMIAGQRDVKDFVAQMETYLECLVDEEKAARLAKLQVQRTLPTSHLGQVRSFVVLCVCSAWFETAEAATWVIAGERGDGKDCGSEQRAFPLRYVREAVLRCGLAQ